MNKRNNPLPGSQGFTLIELLIVIVIIVILFAIVISAVNPDALRNRTRDSTVRTQITKAALAAKSLAVSSTRSTNVAPTEAEFVESITNDTARGTTCNENDPTNASADPCIYSISGVAMPSTCGATSYNGVGGTSLCEFAFHRNVDNFRIAARGSAKPEVLFVYEYAADAGDGSVSDGFYSCPVTTSVAVSPTTVAGCTLIE